MKTIKVRHFVTYTNNGCDCCEALPWDNYEIDCLDRPFPDMEYLMETYLREVVGVEFEIEYEEED